MIEVNSIFRSSTQRGGLNPEALETLSSEFKIPLYHLDYQLRHPFGIYNVSANRIMSEFEEVTNELTNTKQYDFRSNKLDPDWDKNLLLHLEKLLYALMEHIDDCENIIKCFYPIGTKLAQEVNFRAYQSAINLYRTHIGKVVNHLKHNQGRLRSFGMLDNDIVHLGYFVEGLSSDGSLGPAPKIHKRGSTAFSYARDIRYHLYSLYYVSQKLTQTLEAISTPDKNKVMYKIGDNNIDLEKILYGVINLPFVVFPDELQKDFPSVTLERHQGQLRLTLSSNKRPIGLHSGSPPIKYVAFYMGDGVSRSFRLPYKR
jgi:hypothetical protein